MKKEELKLTELRERFINQRYVSKEELRKFYTHIFPNLNEQQFRRILYALERDKYIGSSGSGIYEFQTPFSSLYRTKTVFIPDLSNQIQEINDVMRDSFPYLSFLFWETKILNEFTIHQSIHNQIYIEVEKETEESVLNLLITKFPTRVFLDPSRTTIDRYVLSQPEAIIITKLITQTPMGKKVNDVPYAKIEKILVDILIDNNKFFIFQGQELVNIFENVFSNYLINEKSMFRYAGRRNADSKLKLFLKNKTDIILKSQQEQE